MKISRRFVEESDGIPMTPLIDIVFLTLIFFMVTTVYGAIENEVDIMLPTADSSVQSERTQGEIFINVRADGTIVVNDRVMEARDLEAVLRRVAEYFPGGAIIIRADREAVHGRVMEVLDACRKADIQNVSFAALPPDAQKRGG
jgi:biopolymer transport protein ExbD